MALRHAEGGKEDSREANSYLDDFGLCVCERLSAAVEPVLDFHVIISCFAADALVGRESVEVRTPIRILLVRLSHIYDNVALDKLGMPHLFALLIPQNLILGIRRVERRVTSQGPGIV